MPFLKTLADSLFLLSRLNSRRVFNLLRLRLSFCWSKLSGTTSHSGSPFALSIEPTTHCTLHCPECPVGSGTLGRPKGFIDTSFYYSLLDELSGTVFWLNLYFQGEPLLHPELPKLISYASEKHIYTVISTNGQQLTAAAAEAIVQSGLSRMIISLDGAGAETYAQYRKQGSFEVVVQGIRHLVAAREKAGKKQPFIQLQCILFGHNEQEIKNVKKLSRFLGADQLVLKTAQILDLQNPIMQIPQKSKYSRYLSREDGKLQPKRIRSGPCFRMWSSAVISWDGLILPCCYDKNGEFSYGKLNGGPFLRVWKNNNAQTFRSSVRHNRNKISICMNCSEY